MLKKAPWMVREGARVERYSTLFDDTAEIPFGLGCGGTVELLFESTETAEGAALLSAFEGSLGGSPFRVVTFMPGNGRGLRRLILDPDGQVIFRSQDLTDEKVTCARSLIPGQEYDGRFVEVLLPPQRLFVLGAGDDAMPLVELAASVGFAVTVADTRSRLATGRRFPKADRVIVPGAAGARLDVRAEDAVVLMTHSYEQDREFLAAMLLIGPRYLGLLGARHRSSLLVSEAAAMLGRGVEACCERLFAPVGMDLGGDGPEAIALSIVAEAHGVMHGRLGNSLRLSAADVAEQVKVGGSSRYLQTQCALELAG